MTRVFNFSPGPAVLPLEVLEQARDEMLDWHGTGMSVMEMSHRGKEFMGIAEQAEADLRELLAVPANYKVLFMQGGATTQFAAVPLNLSSAGQTVDYVNTGAWSKKAIGEARRLATVAVAADAGEPYCSIPAFASWTHSADAAYLHYTPNETIGGVEFHRVPDAGHVPLVADMSSTILSRPIDVSKFGVIYAGAQKNIGPAGLTVVIVRDDLLGRARPTTPGVLDYAAVAREGSMLNTPPTYAWYLAGPGVPVAQAAGRARGHGRAQSGQGGKAVRGDRRVGVLREPGGQGRPVVDERPVHAGEARTGQAVPGRGKGGRPRDARGPSLGGRHARQPLQRHADGGRRRIDRFHGRL